MTGSSQLHQLLTLKDYTSASLSCSSWPRGCFNPNASHRHRRTTTSLWTSSGPAIEEPGYSGAAKTYRPFQSAPLEIVERILSFLPLGDLLRCGRLDRSFHALLSHPHLYPIIRLTASPTPPPRQLLALLPRLLSGTQSLSLRSFSLPLLSPLLPHLTSRLTSLDLSFSAVRDGELLLLAENGSLMRVVELKLKGCRGVKDGDWLASVLPRARRVDLSWSGLESLPSTCSCAEDDLIDLLDHLSTSPTSSDDSGFFELASSSSPQSPAWPSLQHLSLASLGPSLPTASLTTFLSSLPPTLQSLDLSHLSLSTAALHALVPPTGSAQFTLSLVGNDRLTLRGIEGLQKRWGERVEVIHSAVLLSEEEEDVRRFVEMVAGLVRLA